MSEKILVRAAPPEAVVDSKSLFGNRAQSVLVELDATKLQQGLQSITEVVHGLIEDQAHKPRTFHLKQVSVSVEVSAEGGVALVGTMTAGAKGAITLTFERS